MDGRRILRCTLVAGTRRRVGRVTGYHVTWAPDLAASRSSAAWSAFSCWARAASASWRAVISASAAGARATASAVGTRCRWVRSFFSVTSGADVAQVGHPDLRRRSCRSVCVWSMSVVVSPVVVKSRVVGHFVFLADFAVGVGVGLFGAVHVEPFGGGDPVGGVLEVDPAGLSSTRARWALSRMTPLLFPGSLPVLSTSSLTGPWGVRRARSRGRA